MRLELHNDVEGKPPYTVLPEDISDAFRDFCRENGVTLDIERNVFRADNKPYDFGHFRNDVSVEDLRDLVSDWNAKQRAARRQPKG